ncbi:MAG: restriction endonuclease subunit S [Thermoleophilia bacterium]
MKLNELGQVGRGKSKHRPRNDPSLYGGAFPFVQTGDVKAANLYINRYSQTYNEKGLAQSKLWQPGTLCITIAANIAETAILREAACFPDSIVGFESEPDKSDVRFIKYYFDVIKRLMQNISKGTTQDNLSLDKLLSFDFDIPKLSIQQKIASILSAYDDLIENNTRRIRILEEMAQSLYREWFVHFRFPGHKKVKLVNFTLGKIPEGWEVVKFTDVAEVLSGGTPKTKEESYWGGDIPFFTPKDAASSFYVIGTEKNITELGLSKCSSKLYSKDTVFITARGTVGKVVMLAAEMAMNQSCYALVGKDGISQLYLFFLTRQATDLLKKNTGGATFDTIIVDTFKRFDVLKPETEPMSLFTQQVEPIFKSIRNLLYKNINLRLTRDLLLPKLISGEIEVSGE